MIETRKRNKMRHSRTRMRKKRGGGKRTEKSFPLETITVLPHQERPTLSLVTSKNPGLLVWYMMGTGKTITGIMLILNYPGIVINIAAPEAILFVWKAELAKFPNIKNKIRYYAYETIDTTLFKRKTLSNEIVIFDEVHNLIYYHIRNHLNAHERIELIRTSKKRLLMTGTPIFSDITDLVYAVNMSAETNIIPYNPTEFQNRYFLTNKMRSSIYGFTIPLLTSATGLITAAGGMVLSKGVATLLSSISAAFNKAGGVGKLMVDSKNGALPVDIEPEILIEAIVKTKTGDVAAIPGLFKNSVEITPNVQTGLKKVMNVLQGEASKKILNIVKGDKVIEKIGDKVIEKIGDLVISKENTISNNLQRDALSYTLKNANIIPPSMKKVINDGVDTLTSTLTSNENTFANDAVSTITKDLFLSTTGEVLNDTAAQTASSIAKGADAITNIKPDDCKSILIAFSGKSSSAIDDVMHTLSTLLKRQDVLKIASAVIGGLLLTCLVTNIMSQMVNYKLSDYTRLDTKIFTDDITDHVVYHEISAESGDFPTVIRETVVVPYSNYQLAKWIELTMGVLPSKGVLDLGIRTKKDFSEYAEKLDMEKYLTYGVSIGNLSGEEVSSFSPKFYKMLEMAKGKKAVFYSSFTTNGILLFKDFLQEMGHKYNYLSNTITQHEKLKILDRFKKATGECFLLLHPSYTEGISVIGADQIHVMEPIRQLAKKEQVVARVVRFRSHRHLPAHKQVVRVYQWMCEMQGLVNTLRKNATSLQLWANYSVPVLFNQDYMTFGQDQTPDSIIIREEVKNMQACSDITTRLRRVIHDTPQCCINFPSEEQNKLCKTTRKKTCSNIAKK